MTDSTQDTQDRATRFLLPGAGVRGVHVRLADAWATICSNGQHLPAANALLGQAVAASALFTAHVKVDGRLSVQLSGRTNLRTLFAECTAQGTLRGILRLDDDTRPLTDDLREAAAGATLAITIENPGIGNREPARYQGLVELTASTLPGAFEHYFHNSEQLPTRLLLAADGTTAAGLMIQQLPGDSGDSDGWNRTGILFDTLSRDELLACDAATLLHRLFHEEAPQVLGGHDLRFGCSCSHERVATMLQSLGEEEARAALIDGEASVRCEFCARTYRFDPAAIDSLFASDRSPSPPPARLQ